MSDDRITFPCVSFNPKNIVTYTYYAEDSRYSSKLPVDTTHNKIGLSIKQAKRLRKCIEWLYIISKRKSCYNRETKKWFNFRLNMLTLTIPSPYNMEDKEVYRLLLKPFLRNLKSEYRGCLYVWKAEVQDNGALHFHINTNVFVAIPWLQLTWNKVLIKNGLLGNTKQMSSTTTHVKAIFQPEKLARYLSSYISKKDNMKKPWKRYLRRYIKKLRNEKISCKLPKNYYKMFKRKIDIKLWDCSEELKKLKITCVDYSEEIAQGMNEFISRENKMIYDYWTVYVNVDYASKPDNFVSKYITNQARNLIKIDEKASGKNYMN